MCVLFCALFACSATVFPRSPRPGAALPTSPFLAVRMCVLSAGGMLVRDGAEFTLTALRPYRVGVPGGAGPCRGGPPGTLGGLAGLAGLAGQAGKPEGKVFALIMALRAGALGERGAWTAGRR